jgi:hypothetical protein
MSKVRIHKTQTRQATSRKVANLNGSRPSAAVVSLIAGLVIERDQLAAEVARLKGESQPKPYREIIGEITGVL